MKIRTVSLIAASIAAAAAVSVMATISPLSMSVDGVGPFDNTTAHATPTSITNDGATSFSSPSTGSMPVESFWAGERVDVMCSIAAADSAGSQTWFLLADDDGWIARSFVQLDPLEVPLCGPSA